MLGYALPAAALIVGLASSGDLARAVRIHLAPQAFRVAGTVAFAWALMHYLGG